MVKPDKQEEHISIKYFKVLLTTTLTISEDEYRYLAYGWTATGVYVKVWYTYRNGVIRIIGGRKLK